MFSTTTHDFGTVARGAKAVFRFQVKNLYEEDVHLASVRSSCGCTTPQIVKPDLKTFEVGEIVAELDTKKFLGHRQATLTVLIDKPYRAEVQLNIQAFIRGDVVLQPGEIDFGTVETGIAAERKIAVSYAGRGDWKIIDAQSANPNFEVELVETGRQQGKVTYDMLVRLSKDAPVGYVHDQLLLITNDLQAKQFPVDVTGRVMPPAAAITVSPAPLFFREVHPGDKVTKTLVVRGRKPFKIVDVKCDDDSFEVRMTPAARQVHVLPITFTAKDHAGKISRQIAIETDLPDTIATFTAFAEVVDESATHQIDLTSPADRPETPKDSDSAPEESESLDSQELSPVEASSTADASAGEGATDRAETAAADDPSTRPTTRKSASTGVQRPTHKKPPTKNPASTPVGENPLRGPDLFAPAKNTNGQRPKAPSASSAKQELTERVRPGPRQLNSAEINPARTNSVKPSSAIESLSGEG
jgi:hypothetical protein